MTQEAVLSFRIEGTQAALENILKFNAEPSEKIKNFYDVQEATNYRETLQYAMNNLNRAPLTLNLMKEMHKILLLAYLSNS